jgi:serine/threonine protein kinase
MQQIRRVLAGILDGLTEVHGKGFCHYDVTARNVCITGDLNTTFGVKLIDFGLTFPLNNIPKAYQQQIIGTRSCLSPEHLSCSPQFGQAADIFCAGLTTVQMMQGGLDALSPLYGSLQTQVEQAYRLIPETTISGDTVPADFQQLLRVMLSKEPAQRGSSTMCRKLLGPLK